MRRSGPSPSPSLGKPWHIAPLLAIFLVQPLLRAQATNTVTNPADLSQQIQQLTEAMARTQAQLQESQRQLDAMRAQLAALQSQLSQTTAATTDTTKAIDDLRERQEMQATQIATHDQIKVETASKYPLKITGQLLFNGFVNTKAVDAPSTPTLALPGSGSTGATVRQTILGFDARGPHILGAESYADLHVDFAGSPQTSGTSAGYTGYAGTNATVLRLRTVHAGLRWEHTEAFFSLDRPILSPDTPASLTAVAEPALAWSGNLWTWNPQLGITHDIPFSTTHAVRFEAALVDTGDAPPPVPPATAATPPTLSEQSRLPGVEARIAVLGSTVPEEGSHIGVGGYFAPHRDPLGYRFDAWAGTLDTRLQLPARFALTGSFYRGQSLGGLGAGAYKDLAYRTSMATGNYRYRPLSDIGGWAQLQQNITPRLQLNAAFGIDNAFANELRRYSSPTGTIYQNLARNRTYTGNVIYSPSAYLVFSLEYRHLISSPISSPAASSNIIGLGAGYRF